MDEREQRRRERAYAIWEDEGRPEGADLDHWQRAEEQHQTTEAEVAAEIAGENPTTSDDKNGAKPSPVPSPTNVSVDK